MISGLQFALGGLAWTLGEYLSHRFVGHGPKRSPPKSLLARLSLSGLAYEFNREHLAHHATPSYFAPMSRKLLAAGVILSGIGAVLTPPLGVRRAASFALGFGVVYGFYEILHRRIHTHPPRGRYGRWARRHHLLHHHKTPRQNHGVTSALWDYALRTRLPAERVRVPHHVAPAWMLDASGEVRPEFAADYEISRRPAPGSAAKQ